MSEHEAVLLRQFTRTGDAEAFSEITRRYAGLVYSTCLRVTGDAECARDATQETFFQLLKHAGRITGSLGGWLHLVATRRAVDLVRRDSARRRREQTFAAETQSQSDLWAEVSPLVDEAMTEIDPGPRDLLLRHFLQGESTVQMAVTEGVSQPTMSRHVEAALEQLREQLRKKGVHAATAALAAMMAGTVQEAPAVILTELGKMALVTTGTAAASTATATVLSLNAKLAVAAAVAVAGVGGYVAYRATRPAETTPPVAPAPLMAAASTTNRVHDGEWFNELTQQWEPVGKPPPGAKLTPIPTPTPVVPASRGGVAAGRGPGGGATQGGGVTYGPVPMTGGMGFGAMGSGPPPTRATTDGAITLFANALYAAALGRGDLARLEECFAGTAEAAAFRQLLENPLNDAERELQQVLKSLGPVIEVVQTTATEDGLKVKWKAAVRQPFTTTENGVARVWERGDCYELEARLKQVDGEWKIVGF